MCCRYVLASSSKGIERELLAEFVEPYRPFYNAHPGGSWPVVLNESPLKIIHIKWGLVPYWSRWNKGNYHYNTFFTEVVKHPVYRVPVRRSRCLVPANCFFIWIREEGRERSPYVVYLPDQKVFTLAGLYDVWKERSSANSYYSFSLVSTFSCKRLEKFVPTMPVIIPPSRRTRYLEEKTHLNQVINMMRPFGCDRVNLYPVSKLANDPHLNDKRVVQPVGSRIYNDYGEKPKIRLLFDD